MSGADSITGGVLVVAPGPAVEAVEDVLHDLIAGLTGLAGDLVRPRWQPDPPKQPTPDIDWCAFGITGDTEEAAQLIHGDDSARVHTEDLLTVLVSFYGPLAADLAKVVRRGLHVPPSRAWLRKHDLALVEIGALTPAADFVGAAWTRRIDMPLTIRQGTASTAAGGGNPNNGGSAVGAVEIRNILSAPTIINGEPHE